MSEYLDANREFDLLDEQEHDFCDEADFWQYYAPIEHQSTYDQLSEREKFDLFRLELHKGGSFGHIWACSEERKGPNFTSMAKAQTLWHSSDDGSIKLDKWISRLGNQNFNIYFGIHPTDQKGSQYQRSSRFGDKPLSVTHANCLYAEFDAKDFDDALDHENKRYKDHLKAGNSPTSFDGGLSPAHGLEMVRAHVASLPLPPSAIVMSGGGLQAYWLLNETVNLQDFGLDEFARLQERFVIAADGDQGSKDLARVLRVPGTFNQKRCYAGAPRPVSFEKLNLDIRYSIKQIKAFISEHSPAQSVFDLPLNDSPTTKPRKPRTKRDKSTPKTRKHKTKQTTKKAKEVVWPSCPDGVDPTEYNGIVSILKRLGIGRCDNYSSWIDVGLALSHSFNRAKWALELWDVWSQQSDGYQSGVCAQRWKTFRKPKKGAIGIGTLIMWANQDCPLPLPKQNRKAPKLPDGFFEWLAENEQPEHQPFSFGGITYHLVTLDPLDIGNPPNSDPNWQPEEPFKDELIGYEPLALPDLPPTPPYKPALPFGEQSIQLEGKKVANVIHLPSACNKRKNLAQAPTGSGKSYAVCTQYQTRIIIACPTQDLAKQLAQSYGMALVMEGIKVDFSLWRIATTYDGLQKIKRQALKDDVSLASWHLVIDEIHHLVKDMYRVSTLRAMMRISNDFLTTTGITATMPPSLPYFEDVPVTRIVGDVPEKPFYRATVPDYLGLTFELSKVVRRVIVHMNNKHVNKAMKEELERVGLKTALFNSDTKKDDHHKRMINEGKLPDDARVIIVTSLYDDGYSFFDDEDYALILTASSRLSPNDIEQISARLRNNPPKYTILARLKDVENADDRFFSYSGFLDKARRDIKRKCDAYNVWLDGLVEDYSQDEFNAGKDVISMARAQIIEDGSLKGLAWDDASKQWSIDEIAVHQRANQAWATHCNRNPKRMTAELEKFGFVDKGDWQTSIDEAKAKERNKRLGQAIKKYKDEDQAKVAVAIESIEDEIEAEMIDNNFGNRTDGDKPQYQAADYLLRLTYAGLEFDCAKERLLEGKKITPNKVTKLESVIRFRKMRVAFSLGVPAITSEAKFYKSLLFAFKEGDILVRSVIDDAFNQALWAAQNAPHVRDTYWFDDDEKKQADVRKRLLQRMFALKRRSATKREIQEFNLETIEMDSPFSEKLLREKNKEKKDESISTEANLKGEKTESNTNAKKEKPKAKRKRKKRPNVLEVLPDPSDLYRLRTLAISKLDKEHVIQKEPEYEPKHESKHQQPPLNFAGHEQARDGNQARTPRTDEELAEYARLLADQRAYEEAKKMAQQIKDPRLRRRTIGYVKRAA